MMRLAAKHGCAVWDTFGVMGGQTSIARWEEAGLAKKDRIHLTRPGYVALGDLLFSAMMEAYGESREDRGAKAADCAMSSAGPAAPLRSDLCTRLCHRTTTTGPGP
jgi:hypothetical protein